MKFNSQACTTVEQSQRLLSLGLKKETADLCYLWRWESDSHFLYANSWKDIHSSKSDIPAWSLGRLWELYWSNKVVSDCLFGCGKYMNPYAMMIAMIEYDIEDGTFNKDYLDE